MTSPDQDAQDGSADRQVQELLLAFQAELDAGARPDAADFLARHPDAPPEAREAVEALGLLALAAGTPGPLSAAPPVPDQIGDFRIHREVGRGGMGVVYEATQVSLRRPVAVKVLPFLAAQDPRRLRRFQVEIFSAAQLQHQHIVPVYSVGQDRGVFYYAMRFIPGRSLAVWLRERHGTPAEENDLKVVVRWVREAALALHYAHDEGVVHRDVKPGNLLVDDTGHLWVSDFGLARRTEDAGVTLTGDLVGTPRYMSPEQVKAEGVAVDRRTDVYSLGVTLYELVTGRAAFPAPTREEVVRQILAEEPIPPRRTNPACPPDLETVILRAMAKDPVDRYADAQELAADLGRWSDGHVVWARRPSVWQRGRKWARRRRRSLAWLAAALLFGILAGLSGGTYAAVRAYRAEAAARRHAETQEQLALAVLTDSDVVSDQILKHDPKFAGERRTYLERWAARLAELADEPGASFAVRARAGRTAVRLAHFYTEQDEVARAETTATAAHARLSVLLDEATDDEEVRYDRALAAQALASLAGRVDDERAFHWTALAVADLEECAARRPDRASRRARLAYLRCRLAQLGVSCGRGEGPRAQFDRAIAEFEALRREYHNAREHPLSYIHLSEAQRLAGEHHWREGRLAEAEKALRAAAGHDETLAQASPEKLLDRTSTLWAVACLIEFLHFQDRWAEAEPFVAQAIKGYAALAAAYPRPKANAVQLAHQRLTALIAFRVQGRPLPKDWEQIVADWSADPEERAVCQLLLAGLDAPQKADPSPKSLNRPVGCLAGLIALRGRDFGAAIMAFESDVASQSRTRCTSGYLAAIAVHRAGQPAEALRKWQAAEREFEKESRLSPTGHLARREASRVLGTPIGPAPK